MFVCLESPPCCNVSLSRLPYRASEFDCILAAGLLNWGSLRRRLSALPQTNREGRFGLPFIRVIAKMREYLHSSWILIFVERGRRTSLVTHMRLSTNLVCKEVRDLELRMLTTLVR